MLLTPFFDITKPVFLLIFFVYCSVLFSQTTDQTAYCATDQVNEQLLTSDVKYYDAFEQMNKRWENWAIEKQIAQSKSNMKKPDSFNPVTLPVVFHDLTSGDIYANPSLLQDLIAALNTKFMPESDISFCLAKVDAFDDPILSSGGPFPISNGMLDNNNQGQINAVSNVIQQFGKFPTIDYINIYVVDDIVDSVAGFAYGPQAHGESFDGIYIEDTYVSQYDVGDNIVVLTHEMGHYLGLLHTFGRCDPVFLECACTNDNCLVDGDMVCDTPPDFNTVPGSGCTPENTCSTDVNTADPNNFFTSDQNDLINNYMDYGDWSCQNSFTPGQAKRMRYMIDPKIGPRNSLLHSNVCGNCAFDSSCKIQIDDLPPISILAIDYPNTLVLDAASVHHTFVATVNNCTDLDTYSWEVTNLDADVSSIGSSTTNYTHSFTETGNYRIRFTASEAGSDPLCFKTDELDLQVIPPAIGTGNCIDINWTDFKRIEYTGGWVYTSGAGTALRDPSSSGPVCITTANNTANSSPFAIIDDITAKIPTTDPTFGATPFPANIDKVLRVGRVINEESSNPLPDGNANYVEYTFIPNAHNARIRIWYLGLRDDPAAGFQGANAVRFVNASNLVSNSFGLVAGYSSAGLFKGKKHNKSNVSDTEFNNFFFDVSPSPTRNIGVTSSNTPINGSGHYLKTDTWGYHDLDLSFFACTNTEVTLTFYARTNGAINAFNHSYAYFALQCLPSIEATPIDFDLPNVYIDCSTQPGQTCANFNFDALGDYLIPKNMGRPLPPFLKEVEVARSYDNTTYTSFAPVSILQNSTVHPNLSFELCTNSDTNPYEYFKVRYITPCKTYEDSLVFHQGFSHEVDPCPGSTVNVYKGGDIPPGAEDNIVVCDTDIVQLTKPCWWESGLTIQYQWQVFTTMWSDITVNGNQEDLIINDANLSLVPLTTAQCYRLRRVAIYEDPYCGVEVNIASEEFTITDLKATYPKIQRTEQNDVCLGDFVEIFVDLNTPRALSLCLDQTVPHNITISIFDDSGNPIYGTFKDENDIELATGVSSHVFDFLGEDVGDFTFIFQNINSSIFDIKINGFGTAYDCDYSFDRKVTINVKPSAIGGEIKHIDCSSPIAFQSINTDNNNGNGYEWEYSYDDISFMAFGNSNSANYTIPSGFIITSYPLWVRRKAFGPQVCPNVAYSNTFVLNEDDIVDPIFTQVPQICEGELLDDLPTTSLNGITGSWSPVLNNQVTTIYTFTPDPVYTCAQSTTMTIIVDPDCCLDCGNCDDVLLEYGFGDDCNDGADDFDPYNLASCIANASNLGPYNGRWTASCSNGIICLQSTKNGWEFELKSGGEIEVNQIIANLYYPVDDDTAGGPGNSSSCPSMFPYVVTYYLNDVLIHTVNASIPKDDSGLLENSSPLNPILLTAGDQLRVRIDGDTPDSSCDLFELGGLRVLGCCHICPEVNIDLGEDQSVCLGEQLTLTANVKGVKTIISQVAGGKDDAEENAFGMLNRTSSDLELVEESTLQIVGVRFNNLDIPQGAVILNANIQFTADESNADPTNLMILGEATDNAMTFTSSNYNISSRSTTSAMTAWSPSPWTTGDAGAEQQTPDLSSIVQEIVDRPFWDKGNSLAFIIQGSGKRVAKSYNGDQANAPQLLVSYEIANNSSFTYQWSNGATTPSITISPASAMDYSVTITNADACSYSETVFVDVIENCCNGVVEVLVDCNLPYSTLTAMIDGQFVDPSIYDIQWRVHDAVYPGSQNPLTVINEEGHDYSVRILSLEIAPDACQANLEGTVSCDAKREEIVVFPNPLRLGDQLLFSINDHRLLNQKASYSIMTENGLVVTSGELVLQQITHLPLPKEGAGAYTLHLYDKNGYWKAVKFIVF